MNSSLDKNKFLKKDLDILFIALNPPKQSSNNGHYFSGKQSLFFDLLYESGLTIKYIDKTIADDIIFGSNSLNYKHALYGILDLIPDIIETNSSKVKISDVYTNQMIEKVLIYKPKIVCIIHSKVRDAFNRSNNASKTSNIDRYGYCGKLLKSCDTLFFQNYFPNGNSVKKSTKIDIYKEIQKYL